MKKKIPLGISVIYFNDESKSIYAELPPDKEQAKELSKRIYKNALLTLSKKYIESNFDDSTACYKTE